MASDLGLHCLLRPVYLNTVNTDLDLFDILNFVIKAHLIVNCFSHFLKIIKIDGE